MTNQLDFLFSRHSIRQYTSEPISPAIIHSLLEAAMSAPSARRSDPWHFVVIESQIRRDEVAAILEHGKFISRAPLGILVCGTESDACGGKLSYLLQDCSAAIENLLLAANALGLGACWLGVHPCPERIEPLSKLFNLPSNVLPISMISIGYPAESPTPSTRFDQDKVYKEIWGETYGS